MAQCKTKNNHSKSYDFKTLSFPKSETSHNTRKKTQARLEEPNQTNLHPTNRKEPESLKDNAIPKAPFVNQMSNFHIIADRISEIVNAKPNLSDNTACKIGASTLGSYLFSTFPRSHISPEPKDPVFWAEGGVFSAARAVVKEEKKKCKSGVPVGIER